MEVQPHLILTSAVNGVSGQLGAPANMPLYKQPAGTQRIEAVWTRPRSAKLLTPSGTEP